MLKKGLALIVALALVLSFAGCLKSKSAYTDLAADESGNVSINTGEVGETPSFYNYDSNGTVVQLLALKTSGGELRIAFNTCQSCSPSPKAYYVWEDGKLICQNCGFDFAPEQVGIAADGCSPTPVEQMQQQGDNIIIPASYLDSMADRFSSLGGPTK